MNSKDEIVFLNCFEYGIEHILFIKERFVGKCQNVSKRHAIEKFFQTRDQLFRRKVIWQDYNSMYLELIYPWNNVKMGQIRNPDYSI